MDVDVVVIDSGVNSRMKDKVVGGINLSGSGDKNDIRDNIGHGSSILNLIWKKNQDVSVYVIKVCDDYCGFSYDILCRALEHILLNNINCRLINISMGITRLDNYKRLHDLVLLLKNRGSVLIAAYQNLGIISYPAGFEEVIGVDCSPNCIKRDDFEFVENSIINIRASSAYFHVFDENERKILGKGTSYATSNITGILLSGTKEYEGDGYLEYCLEYLRSKAALIHCKKNMQVEHVQERCSCLSHKSSVNNVMPFAQYENIQGSKAVVFPFNKEIHSLARFESMLKVEIVNYYDHRISINNHKSIKEIVGQECRDKIIKPISELDWSSDFDLFVCGHCLEMQSITGENVFQIIIEKCLRYGKKLYCFDDPRAYLSNKAVSDYNKIFFPHVDKEMLIPNRFDKLRKSSKPIVGVYGTSSRQGKHTLQLYLRKAFEEKGFKVGQLGSEPHGYLFGFDYVYPMGYNSSVSVDRYDAVRILNEAIWEIERKDPDIIITGSQSGTVPYNSNILSNLNFSSYEFLVGTIPDAVVLCVNCFDSVKYIEKTIKFIESSGNAKVIALVVFPVDTRANYLIEKNVLLNSNEINNVLSYLNIKTGINTYLNSSTYAENICNDIINYFSN